MGGFATCIMDLLAGFLVRRKIIWSFITPEAVGRWFLYLLRGKIVHKDIEKTPPLKNEKLWCLISHYLIGVLLAGVYLFLENQAPIIGNHVWIALIFGIGTVFLPWFWLLPSVGLGFMASKSPNRPLVLRTNLVNHTNFGVGLFIWGALFHRFFL